MKLIEAEGRGVILYMRQEGRGIGLKNKIRAYGLQDQEGLDTVEANERLGFPPTCATTASARRSCVDLGVRKMRLITNNPGKRAGIEGYGLAIVERVPLEIQPNEKNFEYLRTKKEKLGHVSSPDELSAQRSPRVRDRIRGAACSSRSRRHEEAERAGLHLRQEHRDGGLPGARSSRSRCWSRARRASARPSSRRWSRRRPAATLIRLQCYEGLDEAKALYEWEYSKQLLYTQILKEKIARGDGGRDDAARRGRARRRSEDSVFFSERFIVPRPLLRAITSERAGAAADRRGRQVGPGVRGVPARGALGLPGDRARDRHASRRKQQPARVPHLERRARDERRAEAPLPAPLHRLPGRGARDAHPRDQGARHRRSGSRRSSSA